MEASTYAQRIARNYLQSMVPLPEPLEVAHEHLRGAHPDVLRDGLVALHGLMAALYRGAAESPAPLGLPLHPDVLPRCGSRYAAASTAVAATPRLLCSLGLYGEPVEVDGVPSLRIDGGVLAAYWTRARLARAPGLLSALAPFGLMAEPDPEAEHLLRVSCPDVRKVFLALAAYARAARGVAKSDREPPIAFCRGDMRLVTMPPGRKEPPVTVDDALRSLRGHRVDTLRALAALVTSLGYRAEAKCSSLNRGEWRASYRHPKLGKTIFGYVVEEGELTVRVVLNRTDRILPFIAACPETLRESFYTSCSCWGCGKCQSGPLCLVLDGVPRRLCGYGYFQHAHVMPDEVGALRMLIETQNQFLAADARFG